MAKTANTTKNTVAEATTTFKAMYKDQEAELNTLKKTGVIPEQPEVYRNYHKVYLKNAHNIGSSVSKAGYTYYTAEFDIYVKTDKGILRVKDQTAKLHLNIYYKAMCRYMNALAIKDSKNTELQEIIKAYFIAEDEYDPKTGEQIKEASIKGIYGVDNAEVKAACIAAGFTYIMKHSELESPADIRFNLSTKVRTHITEEGLKVCDRDAKGNIITDEHRSVNIGTRDEFIKSAKALRDERESKNANIKNAKLQGLAALGL